MASHPNLKSGAGLGNSTNPLSKVPCELLLSIFDAIQTTARAPLPIICRAWRSSGTIALYQYVNAHTLQSVLCLTRTLRTTSKGSLVKRLRIGELGSGTWPIRTRAERLKSLFKEEKIVWSQIFATVVDKCPNLQHLNFHPALGGSALESRVTFSRDCLVNIRKLELVQNWSSVDATQYTAHRLAHALTVGKIDLPNLVELRLDGCPAIIREKKWTPLPRLRSLRLRHLVISSESLASVLSSIASTVTYIELWSIGPLFPFASPGCPLPFLHTLRIGGESFEQVFCGFKRLCSVSTVRRLEVSGLRRDDLPSAVDFEWPALTHLTSLSIQGNVPAPVALIESVASSLQHLEIVGVTSDQTLSPQLRDAIHQMISPLKTTLRSLTLNTYDFRRPSLNVVLLSLTSLTSLAIYPGKMTEGLPPDFHTAIPASVRELCFSGDVPANKLFASLVYLVYPKQRSRHPNLVSLTIPAKHYSSTQREVFRELLSSRCDKQGIDLRLREEDEI